MSSTATTTAIQLERIPTGGSARSPYEIPTALPETPQHGSPSPSPPPSFEPDRELVALAPPDKGSQAWLFLFGATVLETTVWGLLNAVGILQNYWTTEMFPDHESTVTLAAALMNGLSFMSVAVFGP